MCIDMWMKNLCQTIFFLITLLDFCKWFNLYINTLSISISLCMCLWCTCVCMYIHTGVVVSVYVSLVCGCTHTYIDKCAYRYTRTHALVHRMYVGLRHLYQRGYCIHKYAYVYCTKYSRHGCIIFSHTQKIQYYVHVHISVQYVHVHISIQYVHVHSST